MIADCSSMRMQSTSCCFNSACDAASPRCFNSAADMMFPLRNPLPIDLATNLAAPQIPGAYARGLVDCVRETAFLVVQRCDRCTALERRAPVLDAGVHLGVDRAEYCRLQRRPAGDAAVCTHEHDVLLAHDRGERCTFGSVADQHVGRAELPADVEHGDAARDEGSIMEHRLHLHADQ